jgi:FlaA1/EpsC-like NDP-sugar epimerase
MMRKFDPYTRANQLVIDGGIFVFSMTAAYLIRFESIPAWPFIKQFLLWLPYFVGARLLFNWKMGIYRFIWRYVSLQDAMAIARSLSGVSIILLLLRLLYPGEAIFARWVRLPISVIVVEFLLSLILTLSARALRKVLYQHGKRGDGAAGLKARRVLLYGAGRAGILLATELKNQPGRGVEIVGFVDDDRKKVGTVILGMGVLGRGEDLTRLIPERQIDEVIISMATASRKTLAGIVERCRKFAVSTKIIPSLQEIFEGHVPIGQVRELRMEELLGRASVEMTEVDAEVRGSYAGKRILVTGAGGSIGSEVVRQVLGLEVEAVALLDKDENSVYELEQELRFRFPEARLDVQIADIRDGGRLRALMKEFRPQIVFHAAAHKHVPLMERQPCEAVLNNVGGTERLLEACREVGVERFVFISTNKAVNPTSVMGATKRVGELLVKAYTNGGTVPSACVRFGNVMGSRGSVIPLFQKQIAEGGPLTVTHPEVVRYFMTIPEAVQLVLCAGALGKQGEVYVLDMGNPRNILELARELVRHYGLEAGQQIEIAITGLRPGEKLSEELVGSEERLQATRFEKITEVRSETLEARGVMEQVAQLTAAARANDVAGIYTLLEGMGLGFQHGVRQGADPAGMAGGE